MHIEGLVLDAGRHKAVVVPVRALAVYQHAVRHPEVLALVQHLPQILQPRSPPNVSGTGLPMATS